MIELVFNCLVQLVFLVPLRSLAVHQCNPRRTITVSDPFRRLLVLVRLLPSQGLQLEFFLNHPATAKFAPDPFYVITRSNF